MSNDFQEHHRFTIGGATCTVVSDGLIPLGDPYASFLKVSREELDSLFSSDGIDPGSIMLPQNNLVVDLGGKRILFETGKGPVSLPGYQTGRLIGALERAGISASSIDVVVLSHAHSDHCGGIVSDDGRLNFPNASYYISRTDFDYWTNPETVPPHQTSMLEAAQRNLLPVADRTFFIEDDAEFLPGIHSIPTPGHTYGHLNFVVSSGGETLELIGDMAHHSVVLQYPSSEFIYDTDPGQCAATRIDALARLARTGQLVLGYHFATPGLGCIEVSGTGYRFRPRDARSPSEASETTERRVQAQSRSR